MLCHVSALRPYSLPEPRNFEFSRGVQGVTELEPPVKTHMFHTCGRGGGTHGDVSNAHTVPHTQQNSTEHACQCGKPCSTKLCPCQGKVNHLSGPNTSALTRNTLKITVGVVCVWFCDVCCSRINILFIYMYIHICTYIHTYIHRHIYMYIRPVRRTTADNQRN